MRTDAIDTYFSLTYATHLVLDRGRLAAMRRADELLEMVEQLRRCFPDVNPHGVVSLAIAGVESEYGDLTEAQMKRLDVTTNADELHDGCDHQDEDEVQEHERDGLYFYDWRGVEFEHEDRVVVPTETDDQARAEDRIVISRTLLQSMPDDWQDRFVRLLEGYDDLDIEVPEAYAIHHFTPGGRRTADPVPSYSRGRTRLQPDLGVLA